MKRHHARRAGLPQAFWRDKPASVPPIVVRVARADQPAPGMVIPKLLREGGSCACCGTTLAPFSIAGWIAINHLGERDHRVGIFGACCASMGDDGIARHLAGLAAQGRPRLAAVWGREASVGAN